MAFLMALISLFAQFKGELSNLVHLSVWNWSKKLEK